MIIILIFVILFYPSYCYSDYLDYLKSFDIKSILEESGEEVKEEVKKEEIKKEEIKKDIKEEIQNTEKPKKSFLESFIDFIFGDTSVQKTTETLPEPKQTTERNFDELNFNITDKDIKTSIKNAIENSPEVKKAELEAEIVKRQNSFTPVPIFSFGNDLATGKMLFSAGVQIPLDPLFTGKKKEEYSQLMIEKTKKEIEQKVIEQYKTISILQDKIQKKQEKINHIKQFVLTVEEQYKSGIAKIEDLIKAKEILWQTETELETLKYELKTQIEKLNTIEAGGK